MRKIFLHLKTGNLYKVLGLARCVEDPNKTKVIYAQLYESNLRGTNESLPIGSLWMRSSDDFNKKFIGLPIPQKLAN